MTSEYFSDRELGPRAQNLDVVPEAAWGGLLAIVRARISNVSFGYRYPDECPDGLGVCGFSGYDFKLAIQGEIPDLTWPLSEDQPDTLTICDLLEFCHRAAAKPIEGSYHSFFNHYHYRFDPDEGQAFFRDDVNRVLRRNGVALDLATDGLMRRLAPETIREKLVYSVFRTSEQELDRLLDEARTKFMSPDPGVRRDGLEKVWDAWERLKTLEDPQNKKQSAEMLLRHVSSETGWFERLEKEAFELTSISNNFWIRHSEVGKTPLEDPQQIDYLFSRMFSFIYLLLHASKRVA